MVDVSYFRRLALAFPDTEEKPHFDIPSFRHQGKIFATYWIRENKAMLKLSPVQQSVFCSFDKQVFFPASGAWGKQGATMVELKLVRKDMFKDALSLAYQGVTAKKTNKKSN